MMDHVWIGDQYLLFVVVEVVEISLQNCSLAYEVHKEFVSTAVARPRVTLGACEARLTYMSKRRMKSIIPSSTATRGQRESCGMMFTRTDQQCFFIPVCRTEHGSGAHRATTPHFARRTPAARV